MHVIPPNHAVILRGVAAGVGEFVQQCVKWQVHGTDTSGPVPLAASALFCNDRRSSRRVTSTAADLIAAAEILRRNI